MDWFNDILETGGELIGGAVDTVGELAGGVIDLKLQQETNRATSADPSTPRAEENNYQQPNGDVVTPVAPQPNYAMYAAVGGGVLLLLGVVYLAAKKGG